MLNVVLIVLSKSENLHQKRAPLKNQKIVETERFILSLSCVNTNAKRKG